MARKRSYSNPPVTGGVRRRRNTAPKMSGDGTIIEYSSIGINIGSAADGTIRSNRYYTPGYPNGVAQPIGPGVVENYSTGKFVSGTKIRWEPSVSFTSPGRVYVGFTDNPEVMTGFNALATNADWIQAAKGLGGVISFPVWQETEINFPTRLRRKMFDVNKALTGNVDELDRSCQVYMVIAGEGCSGSTIQGTFWYHDKVAVEGLQPFST